MKRLPFLQVGASFLILLGTTVARTAAHEPADGYTPTFTKDIAPILLNSCASCHRSGEIGPMSLVTYEEVRPWARAIKQKVVAREMPPWHADPRYGKFRNDRSLTDAQIARIAAWVDAGAPRGSNADMPPVPPLVTGWQNGQPDYVIEMPVEFEVPTEGEVEVINFYTPVPFDHDVFAEALEVRPTAPGVLHHGGPYIVSLPPDTKIIGGRAYGPDGKELTSEQVRQFSGAGAFELAGANKLISYVPGRGLEKHRAGTAKRIPAGKYLQWNQHYQPNGQVVKDRTKLGIWFAKGLVTHEVLTRQGGDSLPTEGPFRPRYIANGVEVPIENGKAKIPTIPPYADNWELIGITPVTEAITLYAMSPHMHLRGKDLKWIVTYPDGLEEIILSVPKYDFNWQIHYELETPLKIPGGSKITAIAHFDNSLNNKYNPGPDKTVYWADQSWDEMYQAFTEYTIDSQDLTKSKTTQPR